MLSFYPYLFSIYLIYILSTCVDMPTLYFSKSLHLVIAYYHNRSVPSGLPFQHN